MKTQTQDKQINSAFELAKWYFGIDHKALGPSEWKDKLYGAMEKALYRGTDCGAWIAFKQGTRGGVTVGSIVEGSDAEFSRTLRYPFSLSGFESIVNEVNTLACAAWDEANIG